MKTAVSLFRDVLFLSGAALLIYGAFQASRPAGFIVAGALAILMARALIVNTPTRNGR